MTVQAEYWARNFGAEAVEPVDVIVTPAPCANVGKPAPVRCTLIVLPATKTEGGIVIVIAEPFERVTNFQTSPATRV